MVETILLKMRRSCIPYASFKKKEETRLEEELMSSTKRCEDNLCESNVHLLEQERQELTALRSKRVEGMIVRSQAKWLYEGEKRKKEKYFCKLEKRNCTKSHVFYSERKW